MKKAVLFTRFPYESEWGGEESHTLMIAKKMADEGWEPIFMGSCSVLAEHFRKNGWKAYKVWASKMIVTPLQLLLSLLLFPFIIWNLRRTFQKISRDHNIQTVYMLSFNEKIFMTSYCLRKGVRVLWVEHQEMRSWFQKNFWRRRYEKLAKKVSIVPISPKNKRVLEGLGLESSLHEIINGVDVQLVQSFRSEREMNLVVFANRFIPKKGVEDFIQSLDILKNENISVKILGQGELNDFVKNELSKIGKAELIPYLKKEDFYKLLNTADVFVSCARDENETFSLNSAEAMAAGCKLVVTNCSGIAHYLEDHKEALLCEPMNPEDLANKIQQALTAPEEMRVDAHKKAEKSFNSLNMLNEYYSLITGTP